jgi:ABC-type nitrate/sulfonate/bicarbonate transport system substrate-binding protein
LALGATLSGAMIARASADAIPLRVGIIPTIANAGYYAADKFGYFSAAMVDAIKQKRADAALIIDPVFTVALDDPALELLDWPLSKV